MHQVDLYLIAADQSELHPWTTITSPTFDKKVSSMQNGLSRNQIIETKDETSSSSRQVKRVWSFDSIKSWNAKPKNTKTNNIIPKYTHTHTHESSAANSNFIVNVRTAESVPRGILTLNNDVLFRVNNTTFDVIKRE